MKEIANSFAEFAAIVMILITLAVSTAAVAQLGSADPAQDGAASQAVRVAGM